jgi:ATP-binding cassette, subfamily G (WHITE), member 2, PDR
VRTTTGLQKDASQSSDFAAPFPTQMALVTKRLYQQFWRSPSYIYSKLVLSAGAVSFSFPSS